MPIQADHPVGCCHHHMQIVRDQENAAMEFISDLFNELIKSNLAIEIYALYGLVQNEQVRFCGHSACKHYPLKFSTGKGSNL